MKRLVLAFAFISIFAIVAIAFAEEPGRMGGSMFGHGHKGGGYGMGPGMMGCQQVGQGWGGMMGIGREGMGYHRRWFQYGVTLMLRNAEELGLGDEQIKLLENLRVKYSKDIIKQVAEMKIAEIDLGALLKEPEINLPEVKEALKKVENHEMQIRYLRIMAFVEAKKILTAEQKNSLKKLMQMRAAPRWRGMMSPSESEEEEGEGETQEE